MEFVWNDNVWESLLPLSGPPPPLMAGPQELGPAALRAGGPASGMFVLAATATVGSRESLSAPQALQCVPNHRSLQRSSQWGGRSCPNHSRWELDHTMRSLFFQPHGKS